MWYRVEHRLGDGPWELSFPWGFQNKFFAIAAARARWSTIRNQWWRKVAVRVVINTTVKVVVWERST